MALRTAVQSQPAEIKYRWLVLCAVSGETINHRRRANSPLINPFSALFLTAVSLLSACNASTSSESVSVPEAVSASESVSVPEAVSASDTVTAPDTVIAPDTGSQADVVALGDIRTIEIDGVVLSSLPESAIEMPADRVELGRLLFWDPILSGDTDVACATCHLPEFGYADGRARSIGVGGVGSGPERIVGHTGVVPRNAPSVLNTAWNGINEFGLFNPEQAPMFWDNRVQGLAAQALEPLRSREEMRGDNFSIAQMEAEVVSRLNSNAEYQSRFQSAYEVDEITFALVGQALADFQTTLVANNAPFDRWVRGDDSAMTAQQIQGMEEFVATGCTDCHSGPMFSDFDTHVLGVPEAIGLSTPDTGDGQFGFRTPSLRQLTLTAPYFHGGQLASLDDVIDFYDNPGESENPNVPTNMLDNDFLNLPNINGQRANGIEQFLNALSDEQFDRSRPESVPSGLPVGGSID